MAVSFFDPRSPVAEAVERYCDLIAPAAPGRPGRPGRAHIGLLANGFADSAAFLSALSRHLSAHRPGTTFEAVTKLSPPTPLTEGEIDALVACDAVIAAYGH